MKKKALVTGGMGFIGGYLVKQLLAQDYEVTVVDKSIYRPILPNIKGARIIEADLSAFSMLKGLLNETDFCFHLAAISSLNQCANDWLFSFQTNVYLFNHLLELIRDLKKPIKLIYASSAAGMGMLKKFLVWSIKLPLL